MNSNKYRILEHSSTHFKFYEVQKKSFFIGWYNFNNTDGYETGYYETKEEAKAAIDRHRATVVTKIIDY